MRGCEEVVPLLGPLHDGALADDDRAWVEDHVRGCASCRDRLALIVASAQAVRESVIARARLDDAAQRPRLRTDQRQAILAGPTTAHVILDPGAVVVGQSSIVQWPEEGHDLFAALHSPSPVSSSFDGASSPRYSRSLFCIFRRAWKRRLITVPLRMPRTFARSS